MFDTTPSGEAATAMTKHLTELPKALAQFQAQHHATGVDGRNDFGRYDYTTLDQTLKAIKPATQYGLAHTITLHSVGMDGILVRLTLMHESGESVKSEMPIMTSLDCKPVEKGEKGKWQAFGSAITYAKKYLLWGAYGLANAEDDDDGQATNETTAQPVERPKAQAAPKKAAVTPKKAPAKEIKEPGFDKALAALVERIAPLEDEAKLFLMQSFKDHFKLAVEKPTRGNITTLDHILFLVPLVDELEKTQVKSR